jgi:phosphatidylglycerophosphate synthase
MSKTSGFKQQIPNLLSFSRLALAFCMLLLLLGESYALAFLVSILAALTDLWDGQFARKFKVTSHFGSILDPIMDKCYLLVISFFLFFFYQIPHFFLQYLLVFWFVMVWLRNITQLLAVPILNVAKRKFQVKPRAFAKWGTVMNMVAISSILFHAQITKWQEYFLSLEAAFFWTNSLLLVAILMVSLLFEIWIFITFFPRFLQILLGKHDTFN